MEETKVTYEDLEKQNKSLVEQVRGLHNQLQQVQNLNNTLYWLFKAVKYSDKFNSEFINKVTNQLEKILTPPEE